MLYWADDLKEVKDVPRLRKKFFLQGKSKLTNQEYQDLKDYINQIIDENTVDNKFVVPGWKAPGSWKGLPLQIIWEKVEPNNFTACALWYGLLIMDVIIDREELWYATKTVFNNTDLERTVYWKNE